MGGKEGCKKKDLTLYGASLRRLGEGLRHSTGPFWRSQISIVEPDPNVLKPNVFVFAEQLAQCFRALGDKA